VFFRNFASRREIFTVGPAKGILRRCLKENAMTSQKPGLHPRNRHRSRYDMALCLSCPPLQDYIVQTPAGEPSVNFADPQAVKMLNKALLRIITALNWDIPKAFSAHPCRAARITFITLPIFWLKTVMALFLNRRPSWISAPGRT
jgi:hypothetical protein